MAVECDEGIGSRKTSGKTKACGLHWRSDIDSVGMRKFAAAFIVILALTSDSSAFNASVVLAYQRGIIAYNENQFPQAIRLLTFAIDVLKNRRDAQSAAITLDALHIRANSYGYLYQHDKAIADYDEAIRRDPRSANLRAARGECLAEVRQFKKALDDCNYSVQLDPKSAFPYAMRAEVYRLRGDWDRALSDASRAITLRPTLWRAYQVRGRAYEGKKQFADAVHEYDQVIRLNPTYIPAHVARAGALYVAGNYKDAAASYRGSVRRFPQSFMVHGNLAWFLSTCPDAAFRNGKEAVTEAEKACQLVDWKDWEDIDTLAAAYAELGEFDRAVEYMNRVLQMPRPDADSEQESNIRRHIEAYKKHQPIRQVPGERDES